MSDKEKFRLCIIGAGVFAEANHFPSLALHFFDDVYRAAVCDLDELKAKRLSSKYGWRHVYTDYRKMIEEQHPDGVIVCLGARNHPPVAKELIRLKIPIFLEKPSSVTAEETEELSQLAKENNVIVQVGHQKRYGLAYIRAHKIVSDPEFGNILQIESKMHGFTVFPTFYTCMLEWQCHNLDTLISFGGRIRDISAMSYLNSKNTGSLSALFRFESGATGTLGWGTYGGPGQYTERIEIISDKGKGVIIENGRVVVSYEEETGIMWTPDWNPISKNQSHVFNGYVGELKNFIQSTKGEVDAVPSIHDEAHTMRCLTKIAESAQIPIEWAPVKSEL